MCLSSHCSHTLTTDSSTSKDWIERLWNVMNTCGGLANAPCLPPLGLSSPQSHLCHLTRALPCRFDGGSDWIVINRNYSRYLVTTKDHFLTTLKNYYQFSLLPAEVRPPPPPPPPPPPRGVVATPPLGV